MWNKQDRLENGCCQAAELKVLERDVVCRHGSKQGAVRYWASGRVLWGQRVYRHEGTCRERR